MAALDSEDDSKGNLISIAITDGRNHKVFKDGNRFRHWFAQYDVGRTKFWAHNLEYDLINTYRGSLGSLWLKYYGSRLISGRLLGSQTTFADSLNLAPMSLAKAGDIIGLKKLKFNPRSREYVVRDALIVHRLVTGLRDYLEDLGGGLKNTIGSCALHLWAMQYAELPLAVVTPGVRGFFRESYYGGRVEVFRYGRIRGELSYIDVNSLYPSVMRGQYPELWALRIGGKHGVARARVSVPNSFKYPPLPYRDAEGRTAFPVGSWVGVYCTNELEYARKLGVKVKILETVGADILCRPFRSYMNDMYAKRNAAETDAERTFLKLLMNSLYGKFGTTGGTGQEIRPISKIKGAYRKVDSTAGIMDVQVKPPGYANVLWSAWTTAAARIVLHKALLRAVAVGAEPLYCDTDSMIFSGKNPFKISAEMGEWKLEENLKVFHAKGPKLYHYKTKSGAETYKAKGVRRDKAKDLFTKGKATFKRPVRLRESMVMREPVMLDGQPIVGTAAANVWIDFSKSDLRPKPKRSILKGGLTKPPCVS